MEDNINWSEAFRPYQMQQISGGPSEPRIDPIVSNIVGKKIYANDRRLINLIIKWKRNKDPEAFDNFFKDPQKIEELRQTLK